MRKKTKLARFSAWTVLLTLLTLGACRAEDNPPEQGLAAIVLAQYPAGIQEDYRVFHRKCSQCHDLSRPLNSDHVLPDEWSGCIRRMKRRSGADINPSEEKALYDFLVYDSSVRKKDRLQAKLLALAPDAQRQVKDKIKAVTGKYE